MPKKIVIIGGVAGGASCAARARRLNEEAEIIILEKGPYISFANCGLPYHVGGTIKEREDLILQTPESFKRRFNIEVRVNHEAVSLDRSRKRVGVKNLSTGDETFESYDALVLSPGAAPIKPPLPGIDLPGIFTLRNIPDMDAVIEWIEAKSARRAVVVGGGYIGLEMAENLAERGLSVALMEMLPQVMPPLDPEMTAPIQNELEAHGIKLFLGSPVSGFEEGSDSPLLAVNKAGQKLPADLVILAIGVRPDIALAKDAGLAVGERGGILVDETMKTSDENIWAVGDAVEVRDFITGEKALIPLAGPANRQGRLAAENIFGGSSRFRGTQGTSVCKIFGMTAAGTGANEKTLKRLGRPYEKVYLHQGSHAGYYPGASLIHLKLLFSPEDGRVLGAQAAGRGGVEKRIDVVATALQFGATVYDLAETELSYAPPYGSAKDPVNVAGFAAVNHLRGLTELAHWDQLPERAENPPLLLDVRTPGEVAEGGVEGSTDIPLDELRDRMNELPKNKEIWCFCASGLRSHVAVRLLLQNGFTAKNISGSYLTYRFWKTIEKN